MWKETASSSSPSPSTSPPPPSLSASPEANDKGGGSSGNIKDSSNRPTSSGEEGNSASSSPPPPSSHGYPINSSSSNSSKPRGTFCWTSSSAIMSAAAAPANIWVLLGLGIAGLILLTRSRKKQIAKDFGAFIQYFELLPPPQPAPPIAPHPLTNLTFAVKDIFDVEGFVTGFGNPDWERTHEPASCTAPAVSALVQAGAKCVGKTHMDEMAYSINGENKHYGTPVNPAAPSRVPGGSSSGSAVAVAAGLVDFALGTDTGGSVRIPAAYCGILGFRPSHAAVSCSGVVPMSQSLDTVGWFARDPNVLRVVGNVLLPQAYYEVKQPRRILIADDCFKLLSTVDYRITSAVVNSFEKVFGRQVVIRMKLGDYLASNIDTLKNFQPEGESEPTVTALKSLRNALQLLQRYEFKKNHEEWIDNVKPALGPGISERVHAALQETSDNVDKALVVRDKARTALCNLLLDDGILVIPTAPASPPKLHSKVSALADFRDRAFSLLGVAGMSGCCQVTVPTGKHDGCPAAVSLIAKHGADRFLLDTVNVVYSTLQKELENIAATSPAAKAVQRPELAEAAKERGNAAFKKKDYRTAIDCYTEAVRLDGKNPTYYSNRAAAYLAMCSFHLAEVDCSKAIELDKKNVKAYMRRGTAREFLGYYKEADEDFKQALILEPMNKTASEGVNRLKKLMYGSV